MPIQPRRIPLLDGAAWIIFDWELGVYRVAFYFIPTGKVGKRRKYVATRPKLLDALHQVFRINFNPFLGKELETATEVEAYIRGTAWGEKLP